MGAIRDAIEAIVADGNLSADEKKLAIRRARAQGLHGATPNLPFTFSAGGGLSITVEEAAFNGDDLVLTLSATQGATPLVLNNPFVFVNPPTHIEDPTGDYVKSYQLRGGAPQQKKYKESPLVALRQIVIDAVRAQAT